VKIEVFSALTKLVAVVDDLVPDVVKLGFKSSGRRGQLDCPAVSSRLEDSADRLSDVRHLVLTNRLQLRLQRLRIHDGTVTY